MSDDQCAWASINLRCCCYHLQSCPYLKRIMQKIDLENGREIVHQFSCQHLPQSSVQEGKRRKKQRRGSSVAVLLTLLAFFAIQLLRESLKDPKEKSQETKAHLLLALNTKSTLLYQKNPLLLFLLELLKTPKTILRLLCFNLVALKLRLFPCYVTYARPQFQS